MNCDYIVYTSLPRNFDPEVEGVTLDSIAESCPGYVAHSIPLARDLTEIWITLDRTIDAKARNWMEEQLNSEFEGSGEEEEIFLYVSRRK